MRKRIRISIRARSISRQKTRQFSNRASVSPEKKQSRIKTARFTRCVKRRYPCTKRVTWVISRRYLKFASHRQSAPRFCDRLWRTMPSLIKLHITSARTCPWSIQNCYFTSRRISSNPLCWTRRSNSRWRKTSPSWGLLRNSWLHKPSSGSLGLPVFRLIARMIQRNLRKAVMPLKAKPF